MGTVTLTTEEFLDLLNTHRGPSSISARGRSSQKKRKGRKDPKLGRAMKAAHARAKKKNGDFRKGWNKSRMMSYAHKLRSR